MFYSRCTISINASCVLFNIELSISDQRAGRFLGFFLHIPEVLPTNLMGLLSWLGMALSLSVLLFCLGSHSQLFHVKSPPKSSSKRIESANLFCHAEGALFGWLGKVPAFPVSLALGFAWIPQQPAPFFPKINISCIETRMKSRRSHFMRSGLFFSPESFFGLEHNFDNENQPYPKGD